MEQSTNYWFQPKHWQILPNTEHKDTEQARLRSNAVKRGIESSPAMRVGSEKGRAKRNKAGDYEHAREELETFRDFYFREIEANYDHIQENFGEELLKSAMGWPAFSSRNRGQGSASYEGARAPRGGLEPRVKFES